MILFQNVMRNVKFKFYYTLLVMKVTLKYLIVLGTLFGSYMYFVEGLNFVDTFYFVMTTSTTVGYGDISPSSDLGKLLSIPFQFFAIGLLGVILGIVSTAMYNHIDRIKKGNIKMKNKKIDTFIIEYPSENKVKTIIEELYHDKSFKGKKICVVSSDLEERPEWFNKYDVCFKNSIGSDIEALNDCNIKNANNVLILAKDLNDWSSDDISSSTATIVRSLNENCRIICEKVRTDETIFKSSKINVLIDFSSPRVLAQEIIDEGAVLLLQSAFSNTNGGTQYNVENKEEKSWRDLSIEFMDMEANAQGFKNPGEDWKMSPKTTDIVKVGAKVKYRGCERI